MTIKQGQYFTTHPLLKEKVFEFILNNPSTILEPSIGQGDLITSVLARMPNVTFDMYEIDSEIKLLEGVEKEKVIYEDFLTHTLSKRYQTIIGNPPYVKTKKGNLYIDFIEKCCNLLNESGELVFIVPSDFFKLTSASILLTKMMENGTFTHIFHPHNEKMFQNASIDVIIFRYCKNKNLDKTVLYNDQSLQIVNSNGLITFTPHSHHASHSLEPPLQFFKDIFDIYVGLVSGKEDVYKNQDLGNIEVLNSEGKSDKYIFIKEYPCKYDQINKHLLSHKQQLITRGIRKFNETNWFEWGAPRNISKMEANLGKDCIYIHTLTRKQNVSFVGKVSYFGGGLIMLLPKKQCDLNSIVSYINSDTFKNNFMFSGRFKIGHRQICNSFLSQIPQIPQVLR